MMYTLAIGALFLFSLPLQLCIAIVLLATSGFPILFFQKRIGKHGAVFTMYKFRTMGANAEVMQQKLRHKNESSGPAFKIHKDPRFTSIGAWLSHTGLDELPQLWNVLRGDMALIGPRPLPLAEEKALKPWMREREAMLPGIISPAILSGNYHKDFVAWMKSDVAYARTKSVRNDATLLIQFVPFVIKMLVREMMRGA